MKKQKPVNKTTFKINTVKDKALAGLTSKEVKQISPSALTQRSDKPVKAKEKAISFNKIRSYNKPVMNEQELLKSEPLISPSGEVRMLSADDFENIQNLSAVQPEWLAKFEAEKAKRGRPVGRNKSVVSISLDADLIEDLRKSGAGWQTRVNTLLRAAVGLNS